ncbi:MAG: putative integral rane protein [Frankiales bacterium]|nr:putative integral rane protein [Frankiales bacterium]
MIEAVAAARPVGNAARRARELLAFGLKQARACAFAGCFLFAVLVVPEGGVAGFPRYDVLLIVAVALQICLIALRIETLDEARAILVFHLLGFALEAYKVSPAVASWSYPGPGHTKVLGVPLFAGFMYAAVGSYIMQAWRILQLRVERHPPYWMTSLLAASMYVNLFTDHVLPDFRWYLSALALGLYARCTFVFVAVERERRMPFLVGFVLVGFFIWLAENAGTLMSVWRYPHQESEWSMVRLGTWSSWTMLAVMCFAVVSGLKHVKARIHLAE